MKKKQSASAPRIRTASQVRQERIHRICCVLLRILLVLGTILFTWITDCGCALGWIDRAESGSNWPTEFVGYGQMMLTASVLLTIGAVLVLLCRRNWLNWLALGCGSAGLSLCLLAMLRVTAYAEEHSFYSRLMDMSAATLYRLEILPTILPYVCTVALCLLQYFSADAKAQRRGRKLRDSSDCPSVLE